jgi:uncharacterized membrane protein
VLGLGLGGFVDGIVAHQLLEWHHMLSSRYPPTSEHHLRLNMVGDGVFHAGCLVLVVVGVFLLARLGPLLSLLGGSPAQLCGPGVELGRVLLQLGL